MCYQCPQLTNFTPFRSTTRRFRDTGHFETIAPNDPKLALNYRSNYLYMYNYCPWFPTFTLVCCTSSLFFRYRTFWDKCTEWPQIAVELYNVKLPYICVTGIPNSQISPRFALRPVVFELHTILRQVHWMTPNWHSTLQRQITLYTCNRWKFQVLPRITRDTKLPVK